MKGSVYVLEDDESISGLIRVSLEMNDIVVETYPNIADFTAALDASAPDVALLDVMLPDGSGLDVLKYIKARHPETCCIILSALGKEEDKVNGLNLGADDYVSKPFSVLELTARVNAAFRRRRKNPVLTAGDIYMDTEKMTVMLAGKPLDLNRKEFELLKYFMENGGKVLPRETILNDVWGYDQGETRTLDNHVARLRRAGITNLETVFGVGYRLCV